MGGRRLDPSAGLSGLLRLCVRASAEEMLALRRLLAASTISGEGQKLGSTPERLEPDGPGK